MTFLDFEQSYYVAEHGLQKTVAELQDRIELALKTLNDERKKKKLKIRPLRIRLREARHKECSSLYRKVASDPNLTLANAFDPGHVRDLIGARIVCHTLADMKHIEESLKKDAFKGLHYIEPPKGEKNWSENPSTDSGYRGMHLDVKWGRSEDRYDYAEIQLRTLLQDAWASLFHDDLYKDPAGVMPSDIFTRAAKLSAQLHEIDMEAQAIVEEIERQKLSGAGRIKMLDAMDNEMYAMASVGASASTSRLPRSPYARVRRTDRYLIAPEAEFDFTIDAECRKKSAFIFIIAGDTPNARMNLEALEHVDDSGHRILLQPHQYTLTRPTQPNRIVTLKRARWKGKRHRYRVLCRWSGVFDLPLESIWCPWGTMYPGAEMEYTLRLEFLRKPSGPSPQIVRLSGVDSVEAAIQEYKDGKGEDGRYWYGQEQRRHFYEFQPKETGDMLCFFMP